MGEAKRRAKLDPNFGQRYLAQEPNWIFDSANDEIDDDFYVVCGLSFLILR